MSKLEVTNSLDVHTFCLDEESQKTLTDYNPR